MIMRVVTISTDIDDFIYSLDTEMQVRIARVEALLEKYGYKLGMPVSKSLGGGLFELRIMGSSQVRLLYCFHKDTVYFLNIFIKKTNKIPKREIDLAIKRRGLLA
jgi:phage-related protein